MWQSKREIARGCNDIIGSAKFVLLASMCSSNLHEIQVSGIGTGTCFIQKIYAPSSHIIFMIHLLTYNKDENIQTALMIMNFAKAFDKVLHKRTVYKFNISWKEYRV
jgi:hypothetical protein